MVHQHIVHVIRALSPCCRERRQSLSLRRCGHLIRQIWIRWTTSSVWGMLQEKVYRSWIHDVSWKLKERLLREWRLLDHAHRHRGSDCAVAQSFECMWLRECRMVDILKINFEPLTFCCVLFVSSILVALNMIDINVCKVLIYWCELCYFYVWDFHTVW